VVWVDAVGVRSGAFLPRRPALSLSALLVGAFILRLFAAQASPAPIWIPGLYKGVGQVDVVGLLADDLDDEASANPTVDVGPEPPAAGVPSPPIERGAASAVPLSIRLRSPPPTSAA